MAYDRTKEQTIVISKEHHTMLVELAKADKRTLRTKAELVIEDAYKQGTK